MFKPIVKYLLRKRAKESDRTSSLVHGDLIMKIAVVAHYSDDESFSHIVSYVKELRKRGKKVVDFYVFFSSKKLMENYESAERTIQFSGADFNLFGKVTSPNLVGALRKEYEVLIDLSLGNSLACDVLVSKLSATWKAGAHDLERSYLLDFMIDMKDEQDIRKLIHHLDHYITQFNNTKAA